jgi:hypothetical protein
MKRKYIIGSLAAFLFAIILFYIFLNLFFTGTKLWGTLMPHTTLSVDNMDSSTKYNDYYEETYYGQPRDPNGCYESPPRYTESELFGKECHFIFYGEVLSCDNYVFEKEYEGRFKKTPITYSCHIIKLAVKHGIYGHLKKGQEVYLLCRWHYTPQNNNIKKGKEGIFITNGLPVKIHFNQSDTDIVAIGSLRHKHSFHYYLVNMPPVYPDENELGDLKTKQDVISYWKENELISQEEN